MNDFEERKAFLQLDDKDARLLRELSHLLAPSFHERIDRFYDHLLAFEKTRRFLLDEATLRRLRQAQSAYFEKLFAGDFGADYLADRIRVGVAHNRVGLSPAWYIGAYARYVRLLLPEVRKAVDGDAERFEAAVDSLLKPVFLDLGIAIDTYIDARDATATAARSQAETSEKRFSSVVENASDGFVMIAADNTITYFNRRAEAMFGYDRSEVLGRAVTLLMPESYVAAHNAGVRSFVETGAGKSMGKVRRIEGRRKDGSVFPIECTISSHVEAGEIVFTGVLRDVSERVRAEDEKKQMQARLLISERMASVGTLAAGIAHEINNPLAYMLANLGFLDEEIRHLSEAAGGFDATELRNALADTRLGGERVRQIVRELRSFSRVEEDRKEPVDVGEVVESSIRIVMNQIRHRAGLERRFQAVPCVLANAGRLGQVFVNLLVNAAQAIREGAADKNTVVVAIGLNASGLIEVSVSDTGDGIAPDVASRLFDPFFTTKPVGVGTGLGLSICHSIVSSLGGTIEVESTPGVGSTFRVQLPPMPPGVEVPPIRKSSPASTEACGPPLRILVIDDEPLLGSSIARLLAAHRIEAVSSVNAAWKRLREYPAPDVILCDLMMPEVTGMDFHAELSRSRSELVERLAFITGGAFTPAAREFLQTTACSKLEKPFAAETLRALVREIGSRPRRG